MKKLIAMVMTAAMVASLVPATAFARGDETATAKIVDAKDFSKEAAKKAGGEIYTNGVTGNGPELRLTMTSVENQMTSDGNLPDFKFELTLDNAKWTDEVLDIFAANDMEDATSPLTDFITIYDDSLGDDLVWGVGVSPGSAGTPQTVYNTVDLGSGTNTATVSDYDTDTKVENLMKKGTGYATTSFSDGDISVTGYTTWKSIKDQVTDGKTTEQLIKEWTNEGWTLETLPSGDKYLTKSGYTSIQVYDGSTSSYTTAFQPIAKNTLAQVFANAASGTIYVANEKQTTTGYSANSLTDQTASGGSAPDAAWVAEVVDYDEDSVEIKVIYDPAAAAPLAKDDYVAINLASVFTSVATGKQATVSVDGVADADDLVYASIEARGITASIKKLASVAEEEKNVLEKDLVIKSNVGDFAPGQIIDLKLSKGFEFTKGGLKANSGDYTVVDIDGNYAQIKVATGFTGDEITIKATDCEIEAVSAKAGATCVMTVKAVKTTGNDDTFSDTTTVEVMKVVEYTVLLSVDEDVDIPVIYSGVNVDNYGITDDSDHLSLEVTAEETFPGAWSFRKGFNFELPEGVYVTDVKLISQENFLLTTSAAKDSADPVSDDQMMQAFWNAYQDGDHVNFEFDKRVFDDVDAKLNKDEAKVTFQLELVADPHFVGDVTLKLTGELVDEQEAVIAKFVAPYEVKAEQNDLIIDYRYTEVPTDITVTEAEAGLWAKDEAAFAFFVEKPDYIVFEDDPTFTVSKDSGLELEDEGLEEANWDGGKTDFDAIYFAVDGESDEVATVTISDMKLFMQRSIPAGAYDLKEWTSLAENYDAQQLFAPDCVSTYDDDAKCTCTKADNDCFTGDMDDYNTVVKEAFVNVVTAGRDQDDASFTTKVVVPVGETKITAGEVEYTIDVPAYINANGYTMLPVRAVAVALGINNNNVLWDQATKTVTILYGQRIITMQVGASVVYVNGAALPASSSVEIKDSRTFLGLRDLATALGVTDITWDASTKTATLNGGNTAE